MRTRAIVIERLGPPEVLVERDVALATPGPGEVHVQVEAAGVNFADLMMREGLYSTVPPRPFSPGFEIAGRVRAVGAPLGGTPPIWKIGDAVVGLLRFGGYARDVIVPATQLFPAPSGLSWEQAAAVPVVFLTAWVCLFEAARARAGETLLVLGAGGGVGTAAVQLGVRHGLRVFATAGDARKRDFVVRELGAVACFDSRGDWAPALRAAVGTRGLDVALDPVGGRQTAACRELLGPLGRLIFYGMSDAAPGRRRNWGRVLWTLARTPLIHPLRLIEPNLGIFGVHLLHLGRRESLLAEAVQRMSPEWTQGTLRPVIDAVLPLDRSGAIAAHERLHARQNLGKVVLSAASAGAADRAPPAPNPS